MKLIFAIYRILFTHARLERLNKFVMLLGMSGLGVLNYSSARASGELHFLRKLLSKRRGPVCFDIGANRGLYAEMIFELCPDARVHCFEPHPNNFSDLQKRLQNRPSATLNLAGCGASKGTLELYDYHEADGSSHASMYREVIERLHGSRAVLHRVPVIRVDDYVKENGLAEIDLLKIDTEGHEFAVLQGAGHVLSKAKVHCVHLEFNEMNAISGVFFKNIFDLLNPGYRLYRLLPSSMIEIKAYKPLYCEIFAFQNIVAFRREDVKA